MSGTTITTHRRVHVGFRVPDHLYAGKKTKNGNIRFYRDVRNQPSIEARVVKAMLVEAMTALGVPDEQHAFYVRPELLAATGFTSNGVIDYPNSKGAFVNFEYITAARFNFVVDDEVDDRNVTWDEILAQSQRVGIGLLRGLGHGRLTIERIHYSRRKGGAGESIAN